MIFYLIQDNCNWSIEEWNISSIIKWLILSKTELFWIQLKMSLWIWIKIDLLKRSQQVHFTTCKCV